jgi:pimeloyl-ACP methyl ester carboxylesterase
LALLGALVAGLLAGCDDAATEQTTATISTTETTGALIPETTTVAPVTTTAASVVTTAPEGYPQQLYSIMQGMAGEAFDLDEWKATPAAEKIIALAKNGFLYADEMDPAILAYWDALGVKKEVHDADDEALKWFSYTPVQALAADNTAVYPVVFCFSMQEGNGIHDMGAEKGIITVRPVELGVPRDGEMPAEGITPGRQVVRILDALESEGYPIDRSRVYATGHSIGGMASAWAALEFPEVIAAIAMHSSLSAFNTDPTGALVIPADAFAKAMGYDIPTWLAVGDADLDQLPIRTEGTVSGLNLWLQVNDCATQLNLADCLAAAAAGTDPAVTLVGVPGDETWTETIDGVVYRGVDYLRADGVKMVEIVGVENHPHWVSAAYPDMAWEFLSKFSKDAEGNLIVAP